MILFLDTETYSEADLPAVGGYAYAAHPSTRVLLLQWAQDDGEPRVEDMSRDRRPSSAFMALWRDPEVRLVAHNAQFDRVILRDVLQMHSDIRRWRDTAAIAACHGLPSGLSALCEVFGFGADEAKDKRGRALIRRFCMPQPRTGEVCDAHTHPAEWAEFVEYARQDIVAMRAVAAKLPNVNMREGSPELALWHLDQEINGRGYAVDRALCRGAVNACDEAKAGLEAECRDLTGGSAGPSEVAKLQGYVIDAGGDVADMTAASVRAALANPATPPAARRLLEIRQSYAKSSVSKYNAVLAAAGPDGRLRGTLQYCGARRTGRWAGRLFQPQNLPRGTLSEGEAATAVEAFRAGGQAPALLLGDVLEAASSCLRGVIVSKPGHKLVAADLSNIEGRGLAALAGEQWLLDAYAAYDRGEGEDLYVLTYARSFGVPPASVTKAQRQQGKVLALACGYGGGVGAFATFAAAYNTDMNALADAVRGAAPGDAWHDAERMHEWAVKQGRTHDMPRHVYVACEVLKAAWRKAHPAIVAFWAALEDAFATCANQADVEVRVGSITMVRRKAWLCVTLPSGRSLLYCKPTAHYAEGAKRPSLSYTGVRPLSGKWGSIPTYGGAISENMTQAWARDVLADSLTRADAAGYTPVLTVHDEIVCEVPETGGFTATELCTIMSTSPSWAPGVPLAAAGFESNRYRK
jgi:DNA polymerase bacteriophage-type